MDLSNLDPEMRERVRACETPEEILALAHEVGRKLTDEELEAVSGGDGEWGAMQCPRCLGTDVVKDVAAAGNTFYKCLSCGHRWY